MANPEHLEILRSGPDQWNWWRVRNQDVLPDLSGSDISNIEVSGATFVYANLERTGLRSKNFFNMDFRWAILRGADLGNTNLSRANLQGADLSRAPHPHQLFRCQYGRRESHRRYVGLDNPR